MYIYKYINFSCALHYIPLHMHFPVRYITFPCIRTFLCIVLHALAYALCYALHYMSLHMYFYMHCMPLHIISFSFYLHKGVS